MNEYKSISLASHKVPEFKEADSKQGWVKNGEDDMYPNYLLDLFNRSSVHNSLVLGRSSYIYGKGLQTTHPKVDAFIQSNGGKESLNEVFKKCIIDEELNGGYYLEIVRSFEGGIATISHLTYAYTRSNEDNTMFYFCRRFADKTKRPKKTDDDVIPLPVYKEKGTDPKSVLFVKNYRPAVRTYSLPDYVGANAAIETNIEINNYHLNNIKNGFSGGFLINFKNGKPTPEEEKQIYRDIEEQHTGTDAAGRIVLIFSEGSSDAPDIIPLTPNDLDKVFEQLRKDTTEEIMVGHRVVSPMLFGIKSEGQLGGTTELLTAFEIFKSTVIREKQQAFLEVFNSLIQSTTGVKDSCTLEAIPPIKESVAVKDILPDLTADERRDLIGYNPLAAEGQKQEKTLAEVIGVDGVQSLQAVVSDQTLDPDVKVAFLQSIFGLTEEVAKKLVYGTGSAGEFSRHKKDKVKDLEDFAVFNQYGRSIDDVEIETERPLEFVGDNPVLYQFDTLSPIEKKILGVVNSNPKLNTEAIAEAVKIDIDEAKTILKGLSKKDLLWVNKSGNVTNTKNGETVVENADLPEFDVVYQYALSPDAQGPAILPGGRTRDFCEHMIRANKVFTRNEIDTIGKKLGYNVWKFRGGWMTQKDGEHTPYCRHIWKQLIVKKK
jgi:predicted transcriptional regulator